MNLQATKSFCGGNVVVKAEQKSFGITKSLISLVVV